ncbi:hypothetical protein ACRARG_02990 [Pseudooceanicola sp. C21-150M6]|uniref:hypothetical protein n=1 Tax=Pseudooceanicola sp. C21-150M6 TaxID=3434355 RepID=UPI003D7FF24E
MLAIVQKDWGNLTVDRQIHMLKKLKPDMLCSFVRKLDAEDTDAAVLRWIAARQELDLGTALTLFFAFDPRRWNLLPRAAFPADKRDQFAVLDALCQRINCGFYLPIASRRMDDREEVAKWLERQKLDAEAGRRGRWVFDRNIIAPLVTDIRLNVPARRKAFGPRSGMVQGIFTPLFVPARHRA